MVSMASYNLINTDSYESSKKIMNFSRINNMPRPLGF